MTEREGELITTTLAHCVVVRELIDELKDTYYFKKMQRLRNHCNGLIRELPRYTDGLYNDMDSGVVNDVASYIDLADSYSRIIGAKKARILMLLIDELEKGNIAALEDGEHKKIFDQLDKVEI